VFDAVEDRFRLYLINRGGELRTEKEEEEDTAAAGGVVEAVNQPQEIENTPWELI
jgi:hypothetical protein